ncbi:M56 family metallopeptidase [Marinilabilia salmonicolor]|uniref:M56 family metallopeptidase n=2 Tax=Marinilabilia salmonicolor TaxID=989 RepID=UPI0003015290|nr:M56 family metallopeptidase [Marinilabilia salmonicolor]
MEAFLSYLIRSSIWLTVFGLIYLLVLRNERFFVLNRLFLLAGLLSAIIFPLITIRYSVTIPLMPVPLTAESVSAQTAQTIQNQSLSWDFILAASIVTGALFFLLKSATQTLMVFKVISLSEVKHHNNLKVVKSGRFRHSFSFFSYIIVNPSSTEKEFREIVAHESAHIRQYHWIDLILTELLRTLQWFNPMAWIYGHFIRQNHEYLADRAALKNTSDPAVYKAILINQLLGGEAIRLGHSFSYSLNKKRFIMMKNTSIPVIRKMKLLIILPVIACIFYAFSEPEYIYETISTNSTEDVDNTEESPSTGIIDNVIAELENTNSSKTEATMSDQTSATDVNNNPTHRNELPKLKRLENNLRVQQSGEKTIEGKVVQENGDPLPGTSVVIVNTTTGSVTDKNGRFKIEDVANNAEVAFSFVGFKTVKKQPEFNKEMVVLLKRDTVQKDLSISIRSNGKTTPENNPIIFLDGKKVPFETLSEISPESIEAIEVLKDKSATEKYGDEGKNGVILITSKEKKIQANDKTTQNKTNQAPTYNGDPIFFIVEEMPQFPGGDLALHNYIANNLKYPDEAKEKSVEGRVYVNYIIAPSGKVDNVRVVRGVDPMLDAEAKRIIEGMPEWKPGKQRGKSVAVSFTSPVDFKL